MFVSYEDDEYNKKMIRKRNKFSISIEIFRDKIIVQFIKLKSN